MMFNDARYYLRWILIRWPGDTFKGGVCAGTVKWAEKSGCDAYEESNYLVCFARHMKWQVFEVGDTEKQILDLIYEYDRADEPYIASFRKIFRGLEPRLEGVSPQGTRTDVTKYWDALRSLFTRNQFRCVACNRIKNAKTNDFTCTNESCSLFGC